MIIFNDKYSGFICQWTKNIHFCVFFAIHVEAINCNDKQITIAFSYLMSKNTNGQNSQKDRYQSQTNIFVLRTFRTPARREYSSFVRNVLMSKNTNGCTIKLANKI